MPSWTNPITWVLDQVVTIAHMNALWRDNFLVLDQHAHTGNPGEGAGLPADAAVGTPSLRTLGTGALQAAVGSHSPHVALSGATPANVPLGGAGTPGAVGTSSDAGHVHPQLFVGCHAFVGGGGIPVIADTWVNLDLDTESYDLNGPMHSTASNKERFVAPSTGYYEMDAQVEWDLAPLVGDRGLRIIAPDGTIYQTVERHTANCDDFPQFTRVHSGVFPMTAGQYCYAQVYQDSGASNSATAALSFASVKKVG